MLSWVAAPAVVSQINPCCSGNAYNLSGPCAFAWTVPSGTWRDRSGMEIGSYHEIFKRASPLGFFAAAVSCLLLPCVRDHYFSLVSGMHNYLRNAGWFMKTL